jgi:hypothetical protein
MNRIPNSIEEFLNSENCSYNEYLHAIENTSFRYGATGSFSQAVVIHEYLINNYDLSLLSEHNVQGLFDRAIMWSINPSIDWQNIHFAWTRIISDYGLKEISKLPIKNPQNKINKKVINSINGQQLLTKFNKSSKKLV